MMKSLYVHIPFCNHICSYCDFCKVFYKEDWVDTYLEALKNEINVKKVSGDFETVYIGGGTPSALSFQQLKKLFDILKPFTKKVKEYSIEVNPESMNEDKLNLMISYHINRISIGVQTFHDQLLQVIGRHHSSKQAIDLICMIKEKGINDINVDLIYGLPQQTINDIDEDIQKIQQLDISHVSIYSLILEEHTVLKLQNYQPLTDEEDAVWYEHINTVLKEKGFVHYEVSNYYRDKPSLHNLTYWHYQDYLGIGLSAHSLMNHHRIENTNSLTQYLHHDYLKQDIELSKSDELFEMIMMGLRLIEGISIHELNDRFSIDFLSKYHVPINKFQKLNMLKIENGYLKTTSHGMNYLNTILVDFLTDK